MNIATRTLKAFTARNLMRKFPEASLSIFKRLALEPNAVTGQDIMSSTKDFNFDDVWLFHGIAIKREGRAIVLSGPFGIGKSTLLRTVTRYGLAEPLDDGLILVGRAHGSYYVLESGLYPVLRTISVTSKLLRVLFRYHSPYLHTEPHHTLVKAKKRGKLLHDGAVVIGSLVTKKRNTERVIMRPVRLVKLLVVTHENDCHPPRRICGETIEDLSAADAEKHFNDYFRCEVLNSYDEGLRGILYKKILAELRS